MPASPAIFNHRAPDVAIIGAGVVGLWCAIHALRAGLSVTLIDGVGVGAGASGGLVGALMPHHAGRWSPKKAMQLEALLTLEPEVRALEAQTGLRSGYLRCGRIVPLTSQAERDRQMEWGRDAAGQWPSGHEWAVHDIVADAGWLDPAVAPCGVARETLAARVEPRRMTALLAASLENKAEFRFGSAVAAINSDCSISLNDCNRISAGHILIATGLNSFSLLEPFAGRCVGTGVKGQAALLRPVTPLAFERLPAIYADGLYVIAHDSGLIAVGSTSENSYDDPDTTDVQLDDLIEAARKICPALRGAEIVERWAGVRPKHESRDPVVAPVSHDGRIIAAVGGFKIGFGIAHVMAAEAIGHVTGNAGPWRDILAAGWKA